MTRRTYRRNPRRGATLVEMSLVLLSMVTMILFTLDIGRVLFLGEYLTERARASARAAVVNNWTQDNVRNFFCVNNPNPATPPPLNTPTFLGVKPSNITYETLGTVDTGTYRIKVTVSGVSAAMFIPNFMRSYTLPTITVEMLGQSMGAAN
jgi:hypothetical protein